jgi:hypothetical protein
MGGGPVHDVFISYSTRDKQIADAACATLEAHGVRCWIAPRDILAGQDFADALVEAIARAKVFVLIFSSHSNASDHVRREVQAAFHRGIVVVPLRIEAIEPSGALEYYLSGRHWLDAMTPPLESQLKRFAENVVAVLGASREAVASDGASDAHRGAARAEFGSKAPPVRARRPWLWVAASAAAIVLSVGGVFWGDHLWSTTAPAVDAHRRQICDAYLDQSGSWQARSAKVALQDNDARSAAIQAMARSGRSGQSIFYVALADPTTPVGDYAAISHFWEDFSSCTSEKALDFDKVSDVVAFPDDFWKATRSLRVVFGANWRGPGEGIPDFMSEFRGLCLAYQKQRAAHPQADPLDCTQ